MVIRTRLPHLIYTQLFDPQRRSKDMAFVMAPMNTKDLAPFQLYEHLSFLPQDSEVDIQPKYAGLVAQRLIGGVIGPASPRIFADDDIVFPGPHVSLRALFDEMGLDESLVPSGRKAPSKRRLIPYYDDIVRRPNIVIEQSPPKFASLRSLVKKSSGVSIGAFAGIMMAKDAPNLMLLTMPAGMIIGGLASGIGMALEEGLKERITALIMGYPPPQPAPRKKQKAKGPNE